jgi:hypothetical protein
LREVEVPFAGFGIASGIIVMPKLMADVGPPICVQSSNSF